LLLSQNDINKKSILKKFINFQNLLIEKKGVFEKDIYYFNQYGSIVIISQSHHYPKL